jgi:hypothetical protein
MPPKHFYGYERSGNTRYNDLQDLTASPRIKIGIRLIGWQNKGQSKQKE